MAAEFPIALQILWHSADIFQIIIHPALLSKDGLKSFPAKQRPAAQYACTGNRRLQDSKASHFQRFSCELLRTCSCKNRE